MLDREKRKEELRERIGSFERVALARLPTPLIELPNLSRHLGGPRIYMKRDDLTGGLTFGGNKTRMLEFRLAPAVRQGADVIVSGFGIQSNHARQIAAAARKLGMDVHLILRRTPYEPPELMQGNLLIDLLLGAQVQIVDATADEQARMIADKEAQLRSVGRRPFQTGFHDEDLSAVAYAGCALELHDQFEEQGIQPDYLFVPSEGATQAGLHLFHAYTGSSCQVVGINMVDWVPDIRVRISSIASAAARTLGIPVSFEPDDIQNHETTYRGSAYGIPTDEGLKAIRLVAETEGILLEPVYTAKAMAGLIDQIRSGVLNERQTVVFLHTGGIPALFCYADMFDFSDRICTESDNN